MSKNTSTSSTKRVFSFRTIVNFVAYIAIFLIGVALALQVIFKNNAISDAFQMVAEILAYIIAGISAFFYARSKRNIWYLLIWIVAVILIIVMLILR